LAQGFRSSGVCAVGGAMQLFSAKLASRRSAPGTVALLLAAATVAACRLSLRSGAMEDAAAPAFAARGPGARSPSAGAGPAALAIAQGAGRGPALHPRGASAAASARPLGTAAVDALAEAAGVAASAGPSGVEMTVRAVLGLAVLYCIMSTNEYIYHRYFQHLGINKLDISRSARNISSLQTYRGDGHVEHHKETADDMSLTFNARILDTDPFRGTAFPWWATCAMTLSVLVPAYPLLSFLGWSAPAIVAVVVAALLAHALTWNALHPHMHGLPDVPLSHGAPSMVLAGYRDSALFQYLRENHEGHHRTEGAHGNYNVCCPLADQIVGTHVGRIPAAEAPAIVEEDRPLGVRVKELETVDA